MKKIIIAIVVIALVAAGATGIYFATKNNQPEEKSVELIIEKDTMSENLSLLEILIKNPDRYKKRLVENYGLTEEKADEFYAAPETWLTFEQIITIKNASDEHLTVYGYEVKDNGKNGIYINTSFGGELGIAPGSTTASSFSILCSDEELSYEEAEALVDEMEISVIYTKTPTEFADGTASVEETKIAEIIKETK